MGFESRIKLAENMETFLLEFLSKNKFVMEKTGYESHISKDSCEILRKIHDDPTVRFLRYMPDYFTIFKNKLFFIEFKVMDSPILLDSRIDELKRITGLSNLSKQNVGVVETAAIQNYENLTKIGVNILVIVYCTFHPKKLLVDWENNLKKFYNDKVKIGYGNASFTPFTNINLDEMQDFELFFKKEFGLEISEQDVKDLLKKIETNK